MKFSNLLWKRAKLCYFRGIFRRKHILFPSLYIQDQNAFSVLSNLDPHRQRKAHESRIATQLLIHQPHTTSQSSFLARCDLAARYFSIFISNITFIHVKMVNNTCAWYQKWYLNHENFKTLVKMKIRKMNEQVHFCYTAL